MKLILLLAKRNSTYEIKGHSISSFFRNKGGASGYAKIIRFFLIFLAIKGENMRT